MKQSRFDNPEYVKYQNDKKKKKDTLNSLNQKLLVMDNSIASDIKWLKRCEERLHEDRMTRHNLWLKIQELEKVK